MKTAKNIVIAIALLPLTVVAQDRYMTRTGEVSFFSETNMENIEAVNQKATSVFDATTGAIEFAVLMKGFEFEKALMQEHFNENYVESDKFPKATFKGKVIGLPAGAISKPGKYEVEVEGDLTMHGVTKHIKQKGTITVDPTGVVKADATFLIKLADYDIKVPKAVEANISQDIQVKVRIDYQKM